jgi:pimeloyl-ACP methyl ester carboxylesterase
MMDRAEATAIAHRDGYVNVAGLRLHYLDYGGGAEAVVALHGFLQTAHAFDAIVPVLVPHLRLLALDLRGRGDSGWGPLESYDWRHYVMDLRGFLDALGLRRFALIGTSQGGMVAMMYAMAHPNRVTRLVMNDTSLNMNRAGVVRAAQRAAEAPLEFANLEEATAWFLERRDWLARLDAQTLARWVGHYLTPTPTGGLRFKCDPVIRQRARMMRDQVSDQVPWSHRWVVWEQARRLTMPLLLLRGARSDVVPRESAWQMVQALPAARWVEVSGVGHAPTLYEPEAQAALREFFGVPSPSASPL